jgi:Domain of unknown function (DUF4276)
MPLRVVVIVEGHGEYEAVRTLLQRIWYELLQQVDYIEVIPWRAAQGRLRQREGLRPVVDAAVTQLHYTDQSDLRRFLLILIDTEGDCACTVTAELLRWAREIRSDTDMACVMPNPMFETWFAAAAESLRGRIGLPADLAKPNDPEKDGLGKGWVKRHLSRKYIEPIDQPRLVSYMSLTECRDSSRSFRKLVKELQQRLPTPPPPAAQEQPPATEEG